MNQFMLFIATALLFHLSHGAPSTAEPSVSTELELLEYHFKDIMTLIPKDDIKNITQEHLENDMEFKAAIAYMQSKEWTDLIEAIREKPEWIDLKKFLKDAGIDIDTGIKCIEKLLENVTVTLDPRLPAPKKNLKHFLSHIETTLPTMKLLNLLEDRVVKGENFKKLFDRLSSEESHLLVEKVFALPEIKRALSELADMGLNLSGLFTLMYTIFGWGEFKPFY